jgi:hypothetical protein
MILAGVPFPDFQCLLGACLALAVGVEPCEVTATNVFGGLPLLL